MREHCTNCDHPFDEPIHDIWKDPNVQESLKDGRSADDIAVMACPKCREYGYYNEGSHFSCRFCNETWQCDEESEAITLADTVTITTDGYDNRTL